MKGISGAVSSADGTLLYLLAHGYDEHYSGIAPLHFDTGTSRVIPPPDGLLPLFVDAPTTNSPYQATMIAATHDGRWLAIWSSGDPLECFLVRTADLEWSGNYLDTGGQCDPDLGPVVAINADASRLFKLSETGLTMYNTDLELMRAAGGRFVPATLDLKSNYGLTPLTPGTLTADGRRIFLPMLDESTVDLQTGTVTAVLAVVDVSSEAWLSRMKPPPKALSLADKVPLGTIPAATVAGRALPLWEENWTALSADEKVVYVGVWPDIATVATADGAVQRWPVALTSPRLAVRGEIVYCTPRADGAGALSIITLAPEPTST